MLAVEVGESFLMVHRRFRERGDDPLIVFVRFLQIVDLQRFGQREVMPFAVGSEIANRPRDFRESARAGNPQPAVPGQGQAGELFEAGLCGREQHRDREGGRELRS